MIYPIDIQHATQDNVPIDDDTLIQWSTLALSSVRGSAEVTLRIVDTDEITRLNAQYRQHNQATNVLAFPAHIPAHIELECPLLGDVVVCPAVINDECIALNKSLDSHWALMVIHGILHLLGYDHHHDEETTVMQGLEIQLLAQLGFGNPYEDSDIE